ncbi:MAG: NADH-quinone oxidoreductase subunit J [Pseudomonadota bacterium]
MLTNLFLYTIAFLIVIFSLAVISSRNPVHAVLSLIMVFLLSSVLFLKLQAEFLAMSLIIVYVGAVAVLFLFVCMMLDIKYETVKKQLTRNRLVVLLVACTFLAQLLLVINYSINEVNWQPQYSQVAISDQRSNSNQLGQILYTEHVIPFQLAGVILLVAMIGSILLTHRIRPGVKRQSIGNQLSRQQNSISLVTPKVRRGLKKSPYLDKE